MVAGPPSSTFNLPLWDPRHVSAIPKSSARKRGLHPPSSRACASPVCWRSDLERRAALCNHRREDLLFCLRGPAWVLRPCFTTLDVELARAGARPHRLQATVSWSRSLDSRSGPVLEGRPPGNGSAGRLFQVEGISCSAPLQVCQSGSVNTRQLLSPTVCARKMPLRAQRRWCLATSCQVVVLCWHGISHACSRPDGPAPACKRVSKDRNREDTLDAFLWSTIFAPAHRPAALVMVSWPLAPAEASTSGKVSLATTRGPRPRRP